MNGTPRTRERAGAWVVLVCAIAAAIMKLWLAAATHGTNDIDAWARFARQVRENGPLQVYRLEAEYNHPPSVGVLLLAVDAVREKTGLPFGLVFRFLPIAADAVSILLLWKLLEGKRWRVVACALAAIDPVHVLVSGFHGNTDPVFTCLLLASMLAMERGRPARAGAWFGISMCVKTVPVLWAPFAYAKLASGRDRAKFFGVAALTAAAAFAPLLLADPAALGNVLRYSGLDGIWGIGRLLRDASVWSALPDGLRAFFVAVQLAHFRFGKVLLFAVLFLLADRWGRKLSAVEGGFVTFAVFLAMTPGFGVQYLSWLSPFAFAAVWTWGAAYAAVAGVFLWRVYAFWSGGALGFANSNAKGQWTGFERALDLAVWAIVVAALVNFFSRRRVERAE